MKEKLLLFKDAEHLTQSKLAEILETQPGNISHILSGRSKPGFELLQKLFQRFPRLNPDWLLLDKGPMYRDEVSAVDLPATEPASNERPAPDLASLFTEPSPATSNSSPTPGSSTTLPSIGGVPRSTSGQKIERVVVFYSDHSFESFEPRE